MSFSTIIIGILLVFQFTNGQDDEEFKVDPATGGHSNMDMAEQFIRKDADKLIHFIRNEKQLRKLCRKFEIVVVLYTPREEEEESVYTIHKGLVAIISKALGNDTAAAAVVDTADETLEAFARKEGVFAAGNILIYYDGFKYRYPGFRSAQYLLDYIHKLRSYEILSVTSKLQRKNLGSLFTERLLGYFTKKKSLLAFQNAMKTLRPTVQGYLIEREELAKSFRIKKENSVIYYKFEDNHGVQLKNIKHEDEILNFIKKNRQGMVAPLNMRNVYYHALEHPGEPMVLALVDNNTPEGLHFLELFKIFGKKSSNQGFAFAWFNPAATGSQAMLHWNEVFQRNLGVAQMGMVEFSSARQDPGTWFSTEDLDMSNEENVLQRMTEWLSSMKERLRKKAMKAQESAEKRRKIEL